MARTLNNLLVTCWVGCLLIVGLLSSAARGQDVSQPPILQWFESSWETIDDRMADVFAAGYGRMWLPPPNLADSGGLSVGYDVFDRFHFGTPDNRTLYGTEAGLKSVVDSAHNAGVLVNTDFIANHNGFADASSPGFVEVGDYPGFVTTLPSDIDGDFHGRFEGGQENERLAGLIDIAQEKNHQFIRHPVDPGDPNNIPGGTIFDQPDPNNRRFYPDQQLGGRTVWSPELNQNVTIHDFNSGDPMAGDPVTENALGLVVRSIRYAIQEIGVDGFRYDAGRHFPRWVWNYLDQGEYLAKRQTLLDGSVQHTFSFIETGDDSPEFLQSFIRKDVGPRSAVGQLGGNRDALDFILFNAMKRNLSGNGLDNDWRNIKNASIDANDDGLANNGSQGVAFAQSHDEGGAYLDNVSYAYMLMRPGNAIVYFNGKQFGENRDFPRDGRGDALGGMFGDTITTLTDIRNTHGRGNYLDRTPAGDEKEMLIYERENSALVVLSNRLDGGFDARTVQTAFAPGTWLVELTGNAEDGVIDPFDDFPSLLQVKPDGTVDLRVPRNRAPGNDGAEHRSGYLIYGPATPQGRMRLTDATGNDLTRLLPNANKDQYFNNPPAGTEGDDAGPADSFINGVTRLTDIVVVDQDQFKLRLETQAVNLLGIQRDPDADGDNALFRIDGGLDANGNGVVDHVTPNTVAYGFENFTDTFSPGVQSADGNGLYEQTIDATALEEGRHYLTGRAFRRRTDGGPPIFADFRRVIYVDLLPPESAVHEVRPVNAPGSGDRDIFIESLDQTADNVHVLLNLGAAVSEADIMQRVQAGEGDAQRIDINLFKTFYPGLAAGNHAFTVVTFEPTGTSNIQRFAGQTITDGVGAGLGDIDHDGDIDSDDLAFTVGGFEQVLYSRDAEFNPAADLDGDGRVGWADLIGLQAVLDDAGAGPATQATYDAMLLRRGDVNESGSTNAADIDDAFAQLGTSDWYADLDSSGLVEPTDLDLLIRTVLDTEFGDANLDGRVDENDLNTLAAHWQTPGGWADADFNGDGWVNLIDLGLLGAHWQAGVASPSALSFSEALAAADLTVPEPTTLTLLAVGLLAVRRRR